MPIKTVLIVDDSPTERHVLTELLSGKGFVVATAENGDLGIVRAKELLPDLILMDVVMPGTNGFQATRALTRDEATKNQETDKIWGMRQGAHDYGTKPVDHAALLAKIAALG